MERSRSRWLAGVTCAIGAAAGVFPLARAVAAVRLVPAQYATITAAAAAAAPGDTIQVAAGTYSAATGEVFPIEVLLGGVSLQGAGAGQSILQGDGMQSILILNAASGGRVSGFTLTGGAADRGGGIHVLAGAFQVDHNLIRACGARRRGAGIYIGGIAQPWIHHNVVWQCFDSDAVDGGDPHQVQFGENSAGLLEHNLIGRGDSNGLFFAEGAGPTIRHNIFDMNGTPGVRGRGICALGAGPWSITHNLFFGNVLAAVLFVGGANVSGAAANDLAPDDAVYGNLDGDPLLADPDHGDFHLLAGSPAIDAGDPALPHDPDGTPADLGPFRYQPTVGMPPPSARGARNLHLAAAVPNPFNPATRITFSLERPAGIAVVIADLRGRQVRQLWSGWSEAGERTVQWDGRDDRGQPAASGAYRVVVTADGDRQSVPLALVR